ncbi:hypothetical protein CBR_g19868 [Chara braunii]|uniref:RRM domain-containing protein n=1 Tax=Chara braunii TaxID=69332 RepID=A0A388KZ28_CHABU|nr:hypothetical protein CBR_g19868 [Chara braunii]|eukprot:GBG75232.1 hypothetical protein CBR_g19868 [Chara braunii]
MSSRWAGQDFGKFGKNSRGRFDSDDPAKNRSAEGDPYCTIFVGRLSPHTTEKTLHEVFSRYGRIRRVRLIRDIVTGASRRYAFIEFSSDNDMRYAYKRANNVMVDGYPILVDYTRQRLMPNWMPRRFGGGLGGKKESGQLRFGGRDRPFRAPLRPVPREDLKKLGIPCPPEGRYMSRHQTPPLPERPYSKRRGEMSPEPESNIDSRGPDDMGGVEVRRRMKDGPEPDRQWRRSESAGGHNSPGYMQQERRHHESSRHNGKHRADITDKERDGGSFRDLPEEKDLRGRSDGAREREDPDRSRRHREGRDAGDRDRQSSHREKRRGREEARESGHRVEEDKRRGDPHSRGDRREGEGRKRVRVDEDEKPRGRDRDRDGDRSHSWDKGR